MINTVNASTGFSNFQLHRLGRAPRLIPPLMPTALLDELHSASSTAKTDIALIQTDMMEAQDNLLQAKFFQKHYAHNANHGTKFVYQVDDLVMLSTFNRRCEY
jgi:hypothetical protein